MSPGQGSLEFITSLGASSYQQSFIELSARFFYLCTGESGTIGRLPDWKRQSF